MPGSKLFLKAFLTIAIGGVLVTGASYLSFVPWLRDTVEKQEEQTGRLVLNNVYELARNAHQNIKAYREAALQARKRELRHIVQVAIGAIENLETEIAAEDLPPRAAREKLLQAVRDFTYGKNDYVFIADYDSRLISHPDPDLHGADFSEVEDVRGNLIVPPMVKGARAKGEGFHTYWWRRLEGEEPVEKLTYYKHLPDRDWVIGTGVYIDDVRDAVEARKQAVIQRLRRHLNNTRIGETGYVYIFDSDLNMIIHPNSNIEGTNFADLENPVTGNSIGKDLIAAAEAPGSNRLTYEWDKPSDPGHYVYDKIAWVRHVPGFDWYIASSVYVEEFRRTADTLTRRIVLVGALTLAIALVAASIFLRRLIAPISRLAETASRVSGGDLSAKTEIRRDDEIGVLATNFNQMIDRLRDQINNMENRVADRTSELARTVHDLEKRNRESAEVNRLGELLQACQNEDEIFTVVVRTSKTLFPDDAGRLYMMGDDGCLWLAASWGDVAASPGLDNARACWAVRRARPHRDTGGPDATLCPDCSGGGTPSLCVPLLAEGNVIGVITLQPGEPGRDMSEQFDAREPLMTTLAEHVALSVTNLRLRDQLRQESVEDPLTGLYNRRRLEKTLLEELSRAERHGGDVGVIMLDVDHFKQFNDTYGHETGDRVLREMGSLLRRAMRREDFACRYGGEEFTLVIPETDEAGVRQVAELVRERVAETVGPALAPAVDETITVSAGVALFPAHGADMASLVKAADDALYRAKESGRNRVVYAGDGAGNG